VILLVVDGLGFDLLRQLWGAGLAQAWQQQLPEAVFAPITSVCPSTTATALTTLWTGSSPAEHAIVGYELWLREYAVVANMILHSPMLFNNDTGGLKRAGFQPEEFLAPPVLAPYLLHQGIDTYAFMHQSIAHSGLSTMHMRQANVVPFRTGVDLWVSMRQFLETKTKKKQYIYAYWGDIDELSHRYGPDDERVAMELDTFSQTCERAFFSRLSKEAREDTLFIVTADHGLVRTPKYLNYELRNHPRLAQALHMQPTGENRLAYFYLRPGQVDQVRAYVESTWPGQFAVITAKQALQAGLLGPGAVDSRLIDRIGDLWVIARGDAYLWWAENKENHLLGRHGGLTQQEMLVPFLAFRL
jgi:predicted AlkP superfamily pyrophosphatase or phosphodiesterase